MSRGQKNSLAKMMRRSPCCRRGINFGQAQRPIPMYLHGFVPSCRRPFAEGRVSVVDHSCPPDFGGANFSVPWTTGKADFAGQLNFFTPSRGRGINKILNFPSLLQSSIIEVN